MNRPNFFCDIATLNFLIGMEYAEDHETAEISVDFIDAPFWFIFSADDVEWKLRAIQRGEIALHDESMGIKLGTLTVNKATGMGEGNTTNQMLHQNFGAFFQACRNLSFYAQENGWENAFGDLNPDESGVMLSTDGEKLLCRVVSGSDRPDMMCFTLFGSTIMGRPYMDDFMERSAFELLSFEDKLEAAEDGDEDAIEAVAMTYLNGDEEEGIDADPAQAVYWWTKLAELDNATAQFNLGLFYAKGFGTERNFEMAVNWLKKAEENGDEDAHGLIEKLQKAVAAEKIIHTGDAQAQADLAEAYMFVGNSLDQADPNVDYAIALDYAQKAAAQDNGDGLWILALAYEHGRGVAQDVMKAIDCYRRGADLGHAPSQHSLACYYFRGDVLEEDHEKAFALCMKAAEQGYGLAMRDIGRCYQFGNGVDCDMKLAIEWYEKSLEIIHDPELEQKVAVFKMLEDADSFDDDFSDEDQDYPGMMEAMDLIAFVEDAGYHGFDDSGMISINDEMIDFAEKLAQDGNEEAQLTLSKFFLTNECSEEQKAKAISWIKALAANGNEEAQELLEERK